MQLASNAWSRKSVRNAMGGLLFFPFWETQIVAEHSSPTPDGEYGGNPGG